MNLDQLKMGSSEQKRRGQPEPRENVGGCRRGRQSPSHGEQSGREEAKQVRESGGNTWEGGESES